MHAAMDTRDLLVADSGDCPCCLLGDLTGCLSLVFLFRKQEDTAVPAIFSVNVQIVNIRGFVSHMVSVTNTQLSKR